MAGQTLERTNEEQEQKWGNRLASSITANSLDLSMAETEVETA